MVEVDNTVEAEIGDPWKAAEDTVTDEVELVEDAAKTEGDPVEPVGDEPEADETVEAEPAEAEAPETEEVDEPETESEEPFEWDGNPETLPEPLQATHKEMVRGVNKKFQEVADLRRQAEETLALARQARPAQQSEADEGPPPFPTEDDTQEQYNAKWAAINEYNAKKAVEAAMAQNGGVMDPQLQELKAGIDARNRLDLIASQPGFTDEIAQHMAAMADADPGMERHIHSDEGAVMLFRLAKAEVENAVLKKTADDGKKAVAKAAEDDLRRKTSASSRATPRPAGANPGGSRAATPAELYAKHGFGDDGFAAVEAWARENNVE